jgi:hypothetical protein
LTQKIAGAALAVAGGGIFIAEAITALAWSSPRYSYVSDFISDLEVRGPVLFQGHTVDSPLWLLMSVAYVVNGMLAAIATVLVLGPNVRRGLWVAILIAGIGYGFGISFDGFFHESPASIFPLHAFGAIFIGFGGNGALLLMAIYAGRRHLHRALIWLPGILGGVGLISYIYLTFAPAAIIGMVERFAAYPIFLAQLGFGIALLVASTETVSRLTAPRPVEVK